MTRIGVLPAAGRARRLGTLRGSKELLPVGGRPVLEYAVERLRAAGVDELRIVTRPEKRDLVERARELGASLVLGEPPTLAASIALGVAGAAPDDLVLLALPDTIWSPVDGFRRLLAALDGETGVVLGLFRADEPERSDLVVFDGDGRVSAVAVKPARPPSRLLWGCAVARAGALTGLAGVDEPGHLFDVLARAGRVVGVRLSDEYVDVGTPAALERARAQLGD